jgi:hypothetical protein
MHHCAWQGARHELRSKTRQARVCGASPAPYGRMLRASHRTAGQVLARATNTHTHAHARTGWCDSMSILMTNACTTPVHVDTIPRHLCAANITRRARARTTPFASAWVRALPPPPPKCSIHAQATPLLGCCHHGACANDCTTTNSHTRAVLCGCQGVCSCMPMYDKMTDARACTQVEG